VTHDGRTVVAGDATGRLHFLSLEGLPELVRPSDPPPRTSSLPPAPFS
jgi:hypothetical protein